MERYKRFNVFRLQMLVTFLVLFLLLLGTQPSQAQEKFGSPRIQEINRLFTELSEDPGNESKNYDKVRQLLKFTGVDYGPEPLMAEGVKALRELIKLRHPRLTIQLVHEMSFYVRRNLHFGTAMVALVEESLKRSEAIRSDIDAVIECIKFLELYQSRYPWVNGILASHFVQRAKASLLSPAPGLCAPTLNGNLGYQIPVTL